jgi:hypothetical protein
MDVLQEEEQVERRLLRTARTALARARARARALLRTAEAARSPPHGRGGWLEVEAVSGQVVRETAGEGIWRPSHLHI